LSRCLIIGPHIHRCTHTSPYAVSRQEIKVFRFCYLPTSNTPGPSVTPSVRNQKGDGDGRCRMPMGAARSCNATPMRCQIIRTSIQIRVFFFLGSSAAAGRTKERSVSSSRSAYFFFLLWLWMTRTAGRNHDYCTLLLLLAVTGCLFVNLFDPSLPPAAPILPAPWTGWLTDEVTFFPG
jgi:hypothetical protein